MVVLPGGQKSGRNNEKVTRITKVVVTLCCAKSRRCESPPLTPNFLRKRQKFLFRIEIYQVDIVIHLLSSWVTDVSRQSERCKN